MKTYFTKKLNLTCSALIPALLRAADAAMLPKSTEFKLANEDLKDAIGVRTAETI
jgi:hypothetical protein